LSFICYLVVIDFVILYLLMLGIFIGVSRPNLDPTGVYFGRDCTDGWFILVLRVEPSGATASKTTMGQAATVR
jgi:hypothetical protein